VSSLGDQLGEVARDLLNQAAQRVDLTGVKDVLSAIERGAAESAALEGEVTSAVPLTDAERQTLEARLRARYGAELPVRFKVDPTILGGLVVRVGDQMVDGSLAAKLNQLRQALAG
jgi:F-type H+-transporting ATPase subunit delta